MASAAVLQGQVFRPIADGAPGLEYLESADLLESSGAIFSRDRRYRYVLWRVFDRGRGLCAFVMLNPSVANHCDDDATIKRCKRLAASWGYGGIVVVNLFGYKATDPSELVRCTDPEGPHNRRVVALVLEDPVVQGIVLAWGEGGALHSRAESFLLSHADKQFCCIADPVKPTVLTRHGDPRHPVRLSLKSRPRRVRWSGTELVLED